MSLAQTLPPRCLSTLLELPPPPTALNHPAEALDTNSIWGLSRLCPFFLLLQWLLALVLASAASLGLLLTVAGAGKIKQRIKPLQVLLGAVMSTEQLLLSCSGC